MKELMTRHLGEVGECTGGHAVLPGVLPKEEWMKRCGPGSPPPTKEEQDQWWQDFEAFSL